MWFIGVEVEQETSALPPKKNPASAPGIEIEISFSIAMKFKYMCHLGHIRSTPILKDLTRTEPRFQKEALGNSKMDHNSINSRLNLIVRVNVVIFRVKVSCITSLDCIVLWLLT